MSDLARMKKLAGINEWGDDEWDEQDNKEFNGSQTLWLLQVVVRHEGTYYAGIYSSKELAWAAAKKLVNDESEFPIVNPVTLDSEPKSDNF